ncbi:MAG: dockerin type I repeat-containing protein, partial [Candidatus Glassbacteria bacterium]|nr:dockerin type I repeat-containing protein [Candidatus Glassbacteria bacterium]
ERRTQVAGWIESLAPSQPGRVFGDINGDGALGVQDIIVMILRIRTLSPAPELDFNGDGKADMADVVWLLKYIVTRL